jgi:hypothetical protein
MLGTTTVRVPDLHAKIRCPSARGLEAEQLVEADASVAIRQPPDPLRTKIAHPLATVDDEKIVAEPVHLGEPELHVRGLGGGSKWEGVARMMLTVCPGKL